MKNKSIGMNSWEYDEQKARLGDPYIMDLYHLLQARTIFVEQDHDRNAVHDYFIRKTPFGSYLLVAGTERVLKNLYSMRFTEDDISEAEMILSRMKLDVPEKFLKYLANFKFDANVWAMPEGEIAFGSEPIMRIEGSWLKTWIIESMVLKTMNSPSLVATYASKIANIAKDMTLADFMLRRAPGDGAAVSLTRAAYIGGFMSTSNVRAAINLKIPLSGTMSHEFIQAYTKIAGSETNAFVIYGKNNPENRIYLVDTFDPVKGIKSAIKASEIIGEPAKAIRIDSGNLIELAKMARNMDRSREKFLGIILTSDIDIETVKRITEEEAPVGGLGIGTKMAAPSNPSALGGVFKLVEIEVDGVMEPVIKISGDEAKILLPGRKDVWRQKKGGVYLQDVIALTGDDPGQGFKPVLRQMMKDGEMLVNPKKLSDIQKFARTNIATLPEEVRRNDNPLSYPVMLSEKLADLRKELIKNAKKIK
ncbi:MAG: nicotinate phosphoribosyltransferase [Minisyncoccia bacterium]